MPRPSPLVAPLLLALCGLAALASAAPRAALPGAPAPSALASHPALLEWARSPAPPAPSAAHTVTLALRHSPAARLALRRAAEAVSDPRSPRYGRHLSAAELAALLAPPAGRVALVRQWLLDAGAASVEADAQGDVLRARMTVAAAERAFAVRMARFEHPDGRAVHRSLEPLTVPAALAGDVELVHGVNDLPLRRPRRMLMGDEELAPRAAVRAAAGAARDAASNAPAVFAVTVRGEAAVRFVPVCADGSLSAASPPCSDRGSALAALKLRAVSVNLVVGSTTDVTVDASSLECEPLEGNSTAQVCTATVGTHDARSWLPYYSMVNVSATQQYADGTESDRGHAPFPSMPVPPVTPQTLRSLYNIPRGTAGTNPNNSMCVGEFEQQYFSKDNLRKYLAEYGLDQTQAERVRVIGPNPSSPDGGEAELDVDSIVAVASEVPLTFWSIKANSSEEIDDILTFCYAWMNSTSPPLVTSLSYGMSSVNVDKFLGAGYLERSYVEFQKVAARGFTLIIASGDTGAGDLGPRPMSVPTCETLHPDWPSSSPWVTAVGSTLHTPFAVPACYDPDAGIDCSREPLGEIAVSLEQGVFWTGGGGFSDTTARPSYQDEAVQDFLDRSKAEGTLPPSHMFNSTGRAYPDVVTVGHAISTVIDGKLTPVDGTSASAPIFAGVIALLNELRLNAGRPPMGFLNPWLYQTAAEHPGAFNDVVIGSNRCGAYVPPGSDVTECCAAAFHATAGFDAVTGLGSPNYGVLKDLV